jgi:DNA (cytosine-5)-methyltransferase 1
MAAFIDLAEASTLETPMRQVSEPCHEASGSRSSLQASRAYHYPHFQRSQQDLINDDKEIDLNMDDDQRVYPLPVTPPTTRESGVFNTPRRSLTDRSPRQRRLSQYTNARGKNDVEIQNKTPTRSKGQSSLQSQLSSRTLELPFGRLAINRASPSAKRRRVGPLRSSILDRKMGLTASPQSEVEVKDAEREENVIDLTISENFPTSNHDEVNPKRRIIDLSEEPDDSEKDVKAAQGTSNHSGATDYAVNLRAAAVSRRLAAPGVRRRLAALGLTTRIDPQEIIDLSAASDSDEEGSQELEVTQEPFRRSSRIGPEDYLSDDEISKRLANLDIGPHRKPSAIVKPTPSRTEIEEFSKGNSRYKVGKNAELKDGNFLRIVSVLEDEKGDVFLSGHLLSRQASCGRLMPRMKNELVWMVEMNSANFEAGLDPTPTEVRLVEAVRIRSITFTNQQYPEMSLKTYNDGGFKNVRDELSSGPLFCRWKSTKIIGDHKQKYEDSLVHLTYVEADPKPKARIRPGAVRDMWRGSKTIPGGSHFATRKSSINLVSARSDPTSEQIQQYTFGDAFCGAGGCSSGASQAGLYVKWGFDKDKDAIGVYAANIGWRGDVECLNEAVDEFCGRFDRDRFTVDVLHISPPCQPFSPAHTVPSEIQDHINEAALFSVQQLLEQVRPRVATIEETEGLVNRHVDWFNALINIFISLGYSVRWKVVKCQDYGVPQRRKRLYIIAAG